MLWILNISYRFILTSFILVIISACSNLPKNQTKTVRTVTTVPLNYALFNQDTNKSTNKSTNKNINKEAVDQDVFYLSQKNKNELLAVIKQKMLSGTPKHIALSEVMESKLGKFTYYGETFNAEQVANLNKGNCMSLAALTGAYAKVIGLDFSYKEVTTLPVFNKKNNLLLSSTHVQTILYDDSFIPKDDYLYLSKPNIVIDYFPDSSNRAGTKVSKESFISMYYKNLAADALIENKFENAFYLAEKAYQFDKTNVEIINLLGVIHRRAGDVVTAENIYKVGMEVNSPSLGLMSNYLMLLKSQQRFVEADAVEVKLGLLDDQNPYQWLEQAYAAHMQNNNDKAIRYYQKALRKAPYLHQAYIGLYQIYTIKGKYAQAKEMLVKALEWTYEIKERKQYKYKLYSLNSV